MPSLPSALEGLVAGFTGDLVPFRADIGDQVKLAYAEHELRFVVATVTVTPCVLAELPSKLPSAGTGCQWQGSDGRRRKSQKKTRT
jgi:hypothetical protein